MILTEKVARLKRSGLHAVRLAMLWEQKIELSGVKSAEDLYLSLGHNHIERKSVVDWEGLTLSREPKDHEKLCIKGIHGAQESSREQVTKILLEARKELISAGLKGIKKLSPAQYHNLTLTVPSEIRQSLRDQLIKVYQKGRLLVAAELGQSPKGFVHRAGCNEKFIGNDPPGYQCECKQNDDEDEFDELDTLTDLTDARVANDVQSRITAAAARFALLGLTGATLIEAIQKEMADGSVAYIDRASTGLANRVINIGRTDEAFRRKSEWERVEYSSLLDQNVCGPCASEDGKEAENEDDLQPVPNPECEGGDWCRCFHVFVAEGNM